MELGERPDRIPTYPVGVAMRRFDIAPFGFILPVLCANLQAQSTASFRVLLGVIDPAPRGWDGTISVSQAGRYTLEGWRFSGSDAFDANLFYLSTPHISLTRPPLRRPAASLLLPAQ
jgi:hypothetical protein